MNVPAQQRAWLEQLEAVEPCGRPIKAQINRTDTWEPWRTLDPDATLWTRTLLANELVFDADSDDKVLNESIVTRLAFAARTLGAVPIVADSGGRGWHAHVWFDADTVMLEESTVFACNTLRVDVFKLARETVYDAIVERAGLSAAEVKCLDRTKIVWNADKKGGMIRDFGSVGSMGYAKTLKPGSIMFPERVPPLWDVSAYSDAIVRRVNRTILSARKRGMSETAGAAVLTAFDAHPCVQECLAGNAPVGERGITMLHLARLARSCELPLSQARAVASQYQAACGASWPEDAVAVVDRVYDEARVARIACPNGLNLAVCGSGRACPKAPLKLSS